MTQIPEKSTFGELLRFYRGKAHEKRSGKPLSQEKFANQLSKKTGILVNRNKVYAWEMGSSSIHQDDRTTLIAIISIFFECGSISFLDQANHFLETGNYRILDNKETAGINQKWIFAASKSETGAGFDGKSASSLAEINESAGTSPDHPFYLATVKFTPGSAPPVPSLVIGRDDDLRNLKENLGVTGQTKASTQVLTAVKGWPGVGKTTIASALAHDPEIASRFPDGVLWTSLGQEPNILSEMAIWGRALGTDEILKARSVEEAQNLLAGLLRNKHMLLIIDDAWTAEDAFPFKVGGLDCAMLITTRLDGVANALAPTADSIYRLKVLKDEDAFELIRQLAPSVVQQHPDECLILVQELEGLPLALQVAGRLLNTEANYGFGVTELIDELRNGAKLLESLAPADRTDLITETTPTIAALLQKSLDRLDDATKDCYAYLGVFAPKPATFDMEAMKFVWQVEDPKPTIKALVDRGLLEFVPELARYQMHALLVMLAKTLLTGD